MVFDKNQITIKCKCGCGEKLLKYDRFWRSRDYICGHYMRVNHPLKGKTMSKERKEKTSGKNHHFYGKTLTDEHKLKIKLAMNKKDVKEKQRLSHIGNTHSEETKNKIKNSWTEDMRKEASKRRSRQIFPFENTSIENIIVDILKEYGIYHKLQYTVFINNRYHNCDIFIPSKNLVIECDSCYWHGCKKCGNMNEERNKYDEGITNALIIQGYEVIRFWEHDIINNIEECRNIIFSELRKPDFHVCICCNQPYEDKFVTPLCESCSSKLVEA